MTRRAFVLTLAGIFLWIATNGPAVRSGRAQTAASGPLGVSAANPHYLEYRGRPLLLISSAEHYGAVINQDFDFVPYLAELERAGLNQTRLWTGFYVEDPKAFNITNNTLAPATGRYIAPWARSDQPGYANGGNKFDLSRWDDAFFARLRNYLAEAERRGVMVEIVLFCPFYQDSMWELSPLNPRNNVNGLGAGLTRQSAYDLGRLDPAVVSFMDTYVRKIVTEVNRFDNLYFELVNEPYSFDDIVPDRFQRHVADLIVSIEKHAAEAAPHRAEHRERHQEDRQSASGRVDLQLSLRLAAGRRRQSTTRSAKSSETMRRDFGDRRICRTGSRRGTSSSPAAASSRTSTTPTRPQHPAGTWMPLPPNQPGGGGPEFRRQMRILADFMNGFAFVRMAPRADVVSIGDAADLTARALVEDGQQYAIYVSYADTGRGKGVDPMRARATTTLPERRVDVAVTLPPGRYDATWVSPLSGQPVARESVDHAGGTRTLRSPAFIADVALKIVRASAP